MSNVTARPSISPRSAAKVPATFKTSYVDPWIGATRTFTEMQFGAPVDDAVFARPAAAAPAAK